MAQSIRSASNRSPRSKSAPQSVVRAAIADYVHRIAEDYADDVVSVTLYGSQARGEAGSESDIDLLIVLRHDSQTLRQALADLAWQVQYEHSVVISDIIRTAVQWREMQDRQFPFYQNVAHEGIPLWKNTSEPTPAYA
jgi:predicted nucleotidyltransferase